MEKEESTKQSKSHNLDRQSSSDSYESSNEEIQTANWIEVKLIGSGGFGNVTLWKNKHDNAHLVIKECRIPAHMLQGMEERWHNEIKLLSKLRHENITTARQADQKEFARALSFPFLCMEYCEGGDLRQVLRKVDNCCGLTEKQIKEICTDVARGIRYLHQEHIVHRDLKPENILLKDCNGKIVYKLTDFGYAKQYTQSSMCTSFVGTMQYVAPEILQNRHYNKDVDFWSCGIVVYECITGRRPFLPSDSPMQWLVHVERKKPQHIAVDWAESGTTVNYYDTLPAHHRLSRVFEQGITDWLRLMLRWKPHERGGQEVSPGEREWFNRLQEILSTKVVFIVCMSTGSTYSYSVTENDRNMEHIMQAIMVDTGIEQDRQILLTHNGCVVTRSTNPNNAAATDGCSHNNTFYLFTEAKTTSIRFVSRQTGYINKLITNNEENMGLSERRRCYGAMYSHIRERAYNFAQLLSGQKALIVYFNKLLEDRRKQMQTVSIFHTKTQAKLEFLKKIHQGDTKSLNDVATAESISQATAKRILSSWQQSGERIDSYEHNLEQLLSNNEDINNKLVNIEAQVKQSIQSNSTIDSSLKQYVSQCVDEAKKQVKIVKYADRLDDIPVDNFNQAHTILMRSLQLQDHMISQFNKNDATMAMVLLMKLKSELQKVEDKLNNLNVQIDSLQERHQADIWRLVEQKASSPPPNVDASLLNYSQSTVVGQVNPSIEWSLTKFKSQVSIETNDHVISTNNDLVKKLEDLSSSFSQQQGDVVNSLQKLN